jgi:hypothetical protein
MLHLKPAQRRAKYPLFVLPKAPVHGSSEIMSNIRDGASCMINTEELGAAEPGS